MLFAVATAVGLLHQQMSGVHSSPKTKTWPQLLLPSANTCTHLSKVVSVHVSASLQGV